MKEAVFCTSMVQKLEFKDGFDSIPLFIDNTSALHVAGNRTYSPRAKPIALGYFFVQGLVEDGTIAIHNLLTLGLNISISHVTGTPSPKSGTLEPERQRRPCPS